jgi:hypothetical protein
LLVFDTRDFCILHFLGIESDLFDFDFSNWANFHQFFCPGNGGFDSVLNGWREPAFRFGSIVKSSFAVPALGSALSTMIFAGEEVLFDLFSAMFEFCKEKDFSFFGYETDSGVLTAGIGFQFHWLCFVSCLFLHSNGERIHLVDDCFSVSQHLTGTCRMARHE